MFTEATLRRLRVTKETFIAVGDGLYVRAAPNGRHAFVYRTQRGGLSRWTTLGRHPAMTLLEARNQAAQARSRGALTFTVGQAWSEYLPHLRRTYDSHAEIERRFAKDVLPQIGKTALDRVTKRDGADLLQRIVERGALVAANRTLADLKHFFDWCTDRGWIQGSPVASIKRRSVGGRERSRKRTLSFDELGHLIAELASDRFHLETRLALALILVTGQRPSEVLGINESEIQNVGTWWYVPTKRTKNGELQKVYLSPQARCLVYCALKRLTPKKPFTCDHRTLSRAVSRLRWAKPFTPHDLRRTMSTRLADLGVAPHVIEKMLNHKMEGAMEVYNRAEYLPERRAAWRLWGATLAGIRRKTRANRAASTTGRLRHESARVHPADEGRRSMQGAVLERPVLLPVR